MSVLPTGGLQSSSSAACSIAGGGAAASAAGNGVLLYVNGNISGNSDLNVANDGGVGGGQGGLVLNGTNNTYTGATLINLNGQNNNTTSSGESRTRANNALPVTTDVIFDTLVKGGNSYLNLNGINQQIASLSVGPYATGGNEIFNGTLGSGTATLTISGTTTPYYPFNGIIADNNGNNAYAYLALVKGGSNTLMLTGPNSYSGGTTINGGGLLVSYSTTGEASPTGYGDVAVNGGTLGGVGNVGLAGGGSITVSVSSGAALAPGLLAQGATARTPGTLAVQAL